MTEFPSGTVTFVFTDLEDSTRLWEEHPEDMRTALARHDAILRQVVEAHGGTIVKSTGDGGYAVFASAADAVRAAAAVVTALHRTEWPGTGPLKARIGLHTGTAEHRDDDYFGPALNRASRLMTVGHGGQILVSNATAALVRDELDEQHALRDLGDHRLKGIARPERVYELVVAGVPSDFPPLRSVDAFPAALGLDPPAMSQRRVALSGRGPELARLLDAWADAASGHRQVALVSGEPGIGKTRLVAELVQRVHAEDGLALYGRCDEEVVVPHQPFVEALRPPLAAFPIPALRQRVHGLEPELARAFPELLPRMPDVRVPPALDPEADRYRFFEAITTLVTGMAAAQPTLIVLDDLHWADRPTLLLLRHVVRATAGTPLLIVGCHRDVGSTGVDVLADLRADLRRDVDVVRVPLVGIGAADGAELVAAIAGGPVAPQLARALHDETGGNPFFLEELTRHLVETRGRAELDSPTAAPTTFDLPDGVRDVVDRRLRRLEPTVGTTLRLAAVVGRDFDAGVVARATARPVGAALADLDQAAAAGLVAADADVPGRYAFSHALIRQTLDASLGTARRAELHATVGEAMEAGVLAHGDAAALARHYGHAVALLGPDKAIEFASRAGHEALADLAFEDAAGFFEDALRRYEATAAPDPEHHLDLLLDLAAALVMVDERAGVETALRAVDAARDLGDTERFGRAVAIFVEPWHGVDAFPTMVVELFDEARTTIGPEHLTIRARLLAFEAFKYGAFQLRGRDGHALAAEAVVAARACGDPTTLSDALVALAVTLEGTADIRARLAVGNELVALGERAGARASAFGFRVLAGVQLELGEPDALDRSIASLERVGTADRWLPARVYAAQWRTTQALLEGRFADARIHGDALRGFARAYRGAVSMHLMQSFSLARELGLLGAIGPSGAVEDQSLLTWAMLTLAALETGDEELAFSSLDALAVAGFDRPGDETRSGAALGMLVEVAARRGTAEYADALADLLEPFRGSLLAIVLGLSATGAADRALGMLDTLRGRFTDADAAFERALALETRMRAHALTPRTRYWHAWSLLRRADAEAATRAGALLDQVIAEAGSLGMSGLVTQAEALRAR
jgi:class 3 adenylate cyclase